MPGSLYPSDPDQNRRQQECCVCSYHFSHSGRIGAVLPTLQIGKLRHRKIDPCQFQAAGRKDLISSQNPFSCLSGSEAGSSSRPRTKRWTCDELSLWTSECATSGLRGHSWRLLRLSWPGRHWCFSPHGPSHHWLSSTGTCNFWLSGQGR